MVKRVMGKRTVWCLIVFCAWVRTAAAQPPPPAAPPATPAQEEGIPVQSELVRARCGSCHKTDDKMRMTRISYRRASPENWEKTIKRMVALNNVRLEPADARAILKYLSDHNGLAPEEVKPIAFEAERRLVEYTYTADKLTSDTCSSCHAISRVMSERRTKEEWGLLVDMHRGYYPLVDNQPMNGGQGFRRTRPQQTEPGEDGRPPDNRHPMERALEHLTKTYPLNTPSWGSWSASMQPPKLAGQWAISGYQPGKGPIVGQVVITPDPNNPEGFNVDTRYTLARSGETVTRAGKAVVYTGFQWRGRGGLPGSDNVWREVMLVERDWRQMSGRWFTGAYDEIGIDVKLLRLGSEPLVFGSDVAALKTASTARALKIYGANLPANPRPEDIGLGQGVKVTRVVSSRPDEIAIEVEVAANAPVGPRDLSVSGTIRPAALMVYDRIDGIKVVPQAGMARVGGVVFPKQLQQFEAVGTHNGPDGKPGTDDDLNLGMVDVKWSVEEYTATFGDDDTQFVGALDDKGLFTPNVDGPNSKRSGNRNNIGDVWIVAEYIAPPGTAAPSNPIRARAHLLVTVPLYMAWFNTGGSQ
jgi:quinohemoprotein amine dehydrogenase